jgi:uncharacterized metal-binding protein YceD (DUF177 family)
MPIETDFHLVFVSRMPSFQRGETQLEEEDCDLYPAIEGKVNLCEVAREQIYLSIPLKPVCREACSGLCVTCGGNRNLEPCSCERDPGPRNPLTIPFLPRRPGGG